MTERTNDKAETKDMKENNKISDRTQSDIAENKNKVPEENIKTSEAEIQSETDALNNVKEDDKSKEDNDSNTDKHEDILLKEDADNKASATKKTRTTKKTTSKTDDNEATGDVKPKKKRRRTPKPSPVEEAKKAAEEEAKRIAEEYAKKPEEEIQKEAEEAFLNLIRIAIDEASYFGGSELKLRKDGQVEITRSRRTAKPLTPDKERGTKRTNKRIFDRDGYPVDSVEEAMEHYYEQFPEKVKNKRKSKAKAKDEDTANAEKTKLDKDKVNENSVESKEAVNIENSAVNKSTTSESDIKDGKFVAKENQKAESKVIEDAKGADQESKETTGDKTTIDGEVIMDSKTGVDNKSDMDNKSATDNKAGAGDKNVTDNESATDSKSTADNKFATETKSSEASKNTKNAKSFSKKKTTKGKKKGKGKEDEKETIQYNFLAELREYAMRERRKRLLKKYPIKKIDEDKDAAFFEVPHEIYQNPKAETCEIEEIVCIRLYDDPYIQMTIDFNLDANVKKPRKKSSIV